MSTVLDTAIVDMHGAGTLHKNREQECVGLYRLNRDTEAIDICSGSRDSSQQQQTNDDRDVKKHARLATNSELSNADLVVTQIQLKPKGTRPVKVPTEMIVVATKAPNA